ncbi:MAG TPA: ROK family protein [Candidatus Acidoferrales bacterium]|nr:ROK family protein [Candidatus Acidoferrales bacterium]
MPAKHGLFLGVDIGGTKVAAGIVTPLGEIISKVRVPMVSDRDSAAGLAAVESAISAALESQPKRRSSVAAIGISCPGPLDPRRGVVINPPNLKCWRNFPLAEKITASRHLPARLDNDANAAALAEALWGAGAGYASVFYATLGTGIGTGVILDGRIYHGRTGAAAEGGHVSIDYRGPKCACGKLGCIEALGAGPAVARRAQEWLRSGVPGRENLLSLAGGKPEGVTAEMVGAAWHAGDKLSADVLRETADLLAIWLGNIVDLFEPDVIIFGGGMGELMSEWFGRIREQLPAWTINSRCREIPLVRARYGEDSGIAGAAALCLGLRSSQAASKVARSKIKPARKPAPARKSKRKR